MVSPSKRYAVLERVIYCTLASWEAIDVTCFPLTESTSPAAPYPLVSLSSITNLLPTEKLLPPLTIEAEDTLPLCTSCICAIVESPFLSISKLLSLLALTGISS